MLELYKCERHQPEKQQLRLFEVRAGFNFLEGVFWALVRIFLTPLIRHVWYVSSKTNSVLESEEERANSLTYDLFLITLSNRWNRLNAMMYGIVHNGAYDCSMTNTLCARYYWYSGLACEVGCCGGVWHV